MATEKSHTSHLRVQKIMCTYLRTLTASLGTMAIFTRSSGRTQVSCTDSTTELRPQCWQSDSSKVLEHCGWLRPVGTAASPCVRTTDPANVRTACANADNVDGNCNPLQACAGALDSLAYYSGLCGSVSDVRLRGIKNVNFRKILQSSIAEIKADRYRLKFR